MRLGLTWAYMRTLPFEPLREEAHMKRIEMVRRADGALKMAHQLAARELAGTAMEPRDWVQCEALAVDARAIYRTLLVMGAYTSRPMRKRLASSEIKAQLLEMHAGKMGR